jgi:polar amino acid transport system ATP-binding protein/sulfate transport system ATP-binding protein
VSVYEKRETILRIDHVSLTLSGTLILRDVNATIENIVRPDLQQGQVIAFLGPSGVGKTLLSRIIAGLQQPSSGSVQVNTSSTPSSIKFSTVRKGMVGMVPQAYPLFDFMTVEDNLTTAGKQAGLRPNEIQEKGLSLMNSFDVWKYRKYYPRDLSGGTRQRIAIIRQLMCSDHFLVMDEPFSGLDLINKRRACELITQVSTLDELNTIIIVTHDVTEGMSVSDTVWLMGLEADPASPGSFLPGARLVEQYDLAALDLCWHRGISEDPRFIEFVGQVKNRFLSLGK